MGGRFISRRRAKPSGVHLSRADVAQAKGMLLRGDRQHDIAAWFGVNAGRIAEIATGATWATVVPTEAEALPPPGPYQSGRAAHAAMVALAEAQAALADAQRRLMEKAA